MAAIRMAYVAWVELAPGRIRTRDAVALGSVLALLAVSGCGGTVVPPAGAAPARVIATASCAQLPLAAAPLPDELGVYRAGPLTLSAGDDLAQHPEEWPGRRTSGSEAIVLISDGEAAVLSVDPASRGRFSLRFTPTGRGHPSPTLSDGLAAVRFPACRGPRHRFGGAVLFRGRGCARLHVTQFGRPAVPMLVPIGNAVGDCPVVGRLQTLDSGATPYLGVACPVGNAIGCDRVGVGVYLHRPATLVAVRVTGRWVTLSPPSDVSGEDLWLGRLLGAGLMRGALKVDTHDGLWFGQPEVLVRARVMAFFPDGHAAALSTAVQLHAGFG